MNRFAVIPRWVYLVSAVAWAFFLAGEDVQAQSAGAFSERGFGVRGIALGNAQVADAFGGGSPWYNPALAPLYSDQMIEAAYTFLSQDRRLEYLQFAIPMKPRAGVAVGLIHGGVSNIDGRDASGYHTETYSTDDYAAFLAFGSRVGSKATIGIAFRFFRSTLLPELDANSIGIQIGTTVELRENLFFGASLDNILSRFEWDSSDVLGSSGQKSTDDFPIKLRVGLAYRLMEEKLTLLGEYESRFENVDVPRPGVDVIGGSPRSTTTLEELTLHQSSFRAGAEYQIAEVLLLRLGLDRIGSGSGEIIPTAGFTLNYAVGELGTRFDYTFGKEAFGLGTFHLIGIRFYI